MTSKSSPLITEVVASLRSDVDEISSDLYGNERTHTPGVIDRQRENTQQIARMVLVVWGLIIVTVLNIATVAMAVLVR